MGSGGRGGEFPVPSPDSGNTYYGNASSIIPRVTPGGITGTGAGAKTYTDAGTGAGAKTYTDAGTGTGSGTVSPYTNPPAGTTQTDVAAAAAAARQARLDELAAQLRAAERQYSTLTEQYGQFAGSSGAMPGYMPGSPSTGYTTPGTSQAQTLSPGTYAAPVIDFLAGVPSYLQTSPDLQIPDFTGQYAIQPIPGLSGTQAGPTTDVSAPFQPYLEAIYNQYGVNIPSGMTGIMGARR